MTSQPAPRNKTITLTPEETDKYANKNQNQRHFR